MRQGHANPRIADFELMNIVRGDHGCALRFDHEAIEQDLVPRFQNERTGWSFDERIRSTAANDHTILGEADGRGELMHSFLDANDDGAALASIREGGEGSIERIVIAMGQHAMADADGATTTALLADRNFGERRKHRRTTRPRHSREQARVARR